MIPALGLHSNGTPYDDNGFREDGTYGDTGSPYNENGCTFDGKKEDGSACDPSSGPNPAAEDFAESIADNFSGTVSSIITQLKSDFQSQLNALDCGAIRTELSSLVTTLSYDPIFIFGENNEYLNEDMHLNFESKPQKLSLNIERDANTKLLEERHVDLYDCDKEQYKLNILINVLTSLESGTEFDNLVAQLLAMVSSLPEHLLNIYKEDTGAFNNWVQSKIEETMRGEAGLERWLLWLSSTPF